MSKEPIAVVVNILGKEYRIACPPEEKNALLNAASTLNERMKVLRESGKVIGTERIAVMTALNVTHELLQQQSAQSDLNSASEKVREMNEQIQVTIGQARQIELYSHRD